MGTIQIGLQKWKYTLKKIKQYSHIQITKTEGSQQAPQRTTAYLDYDKLVPHFVLCLFADIFSKSTSQLMASQFIVYGNTKGLLYLAIQSKEQYLKVNVSTLACSVGHITSLQCHYCTQTHSEYSIVQYQKQW